MGVAALLHAHDVGAHLALNRVRDTQIAVLHEG
jgi:hypothetical protein